MSRVCPECGMSDDLYSTEPADMAEWEDFHDNLCSGRWHVEEGAPTGEAMWRLNERVSRYVCGECDYDKRGQWRAHQAHYETHRATN